ncbi:hypothetical protein [Brachybacterium hainanense]|uniref:Uncharacterized protein n=1 Tax=Brachybacterium hainanense TaxID=1541174 RepID=A0ABV6RC45_9MICO
MSDFEEAARKAGPKDWPAVNAAFVDGALWGRARMFPEEITDGELDAMREATQTHLPRWVPAADRHECRCGFTGTRDAAQEHQFREAASAMRAAARKEQTR